MKIEIVKIATLNPAEYNPRRISQKQMEDLKKSLKRFGFVDPVIVNINGNVVIGGHQRLKAWQALGHDWAPVHYVDLSKKRERELNIRLNANGGEFDFGALDKFFNKEELGEWGLDISFGMDDGEDVREEDKNKIKEIATPLIKTHGVSVQVGDIYQLGKHRVMCGDATSRDDVNRLMNGAKASLVFTDPPYGMKKANIENDNLNNKQLLEFNKKWIPLSFSVLKDNGSWYCWGIDEPLMDIYSNILKPMIRENKITFRNLITWDKGNGQGQNNDNTRGYAIADEKCLFVMCGVQGFNNNADNYYEGFDPIRLYLKEEFSKVGTLAECARIIGVSGKMISHYVSKSQWTMSPKEAYEKMQNYCKQNNIRAFEEEYEDIKKEYEDIKKEYEDIKKEWYKTRAYFNNTHDNMNNVWHFGRHIKQGDEGGHSTPKPIPLCERGILSSSRENEIVLDLFLGSGSTVIACETTRRACYGLELSPQYVDVIIRRWENCTGGKAEKIN